ncbi:plasma membrane calcium [Puttea exsequens]|nr:plasma membrane calcium [Puttea exsequens]
MAANRMLAPPIEIHTSVSGYNQSESVRTDMCQLQSQDAESPESDAQSPEPSASLQVPSPSSPAKQSLGGSTLRARADSSLSVAETARSRTDSFNSTMTAETARSRSNSQITNTTSRFEGDELSTEEALRPDKNNERDFEVTDNPFAYSPGQLNKTLNPKSLAAYKALGGLRGLEHGLQTDLVAGLSVDETLTKERVSFEEARRYGKEKKLPHAGRVIGHDVATGDFEGKGQYHDRIRVFKDNRLPAKKSLSIWMLFWNAFNDRVLIILTIAATISFALGLYEALGQAHEPGEGASVDWVEGVAIAVAVVIVVLVTGLNDYRREKQFAVLNAKKEDRQVKAIRSGKSVMISVFDVMVGDVLHLESGDSIPADGILISGHGIRCDESSATGESDAMKKSAGQEVWERIEEGTANSKLDPFIISGSKVLEGVGTYLVTSVGVNSSFGKIMMSLQTENEDTPLQAKLAKMANWIGYLGTAAAGLLFFVLLFRFLAGLSNNHDSPAVRGSTFLDIFIVAVTIIVVAVPEGLPVAVTLALSFATKRMLKENNLVRHLRACETMGNATTICSDKTGTLTQNKMTVVAGIMGSKVRYARDVNGIAGEQNHLPSAAAFGQLSNAVKGVFLQSCAINSTAFEGEENGEFTFIGSKTETAILTLAKEQLGMGPVAEERAGVNIVQMIPFDSDRKCMGVVVRLSSGTYRLFVKGAAELMLVKATTEIANTAGENLVECDLTEESRARVSKSIEDFAWQSLRTIAMLYKDFSQWPPAKARTSEEDRTMAIFEDVFHDMTLLGVVGIQDPLRDGVARAVKQCQDAGVKVRMVTGDNVMTATAIATQCGIKTADGLVLEGPKFRQLSDEEMDRAIPHLEVLARSSPEDKRILVARLKHLGETVAVTGDGTNDGPALKTADIGFSMGIAGTEVAKEASAIILMDDNFSSIVSAIMWGRSVNDAVAKFLQFQITVNITAVVLAFVSAVSSPDFHSVLSAVQLLWVNLIMDTFAALALATDAPTEKILNRKPTPKKAALITTNMWKMIIGQAIYQLVITFTLYYGGSSILGYAKSDKTLQTELNTMVFNTFVWMQIFNEFNNRRLDNKFNIFEGVHRNGFFAIINCIMIAGQIMIVFIGGAAFQIKRIDGTQWAICILCALPCLLWAIVLRCIPDRYAAAIFSFTNNVFLFIARPTMKALLFVFKPVVKSWQALAAGVFSPTVRFTKRTVRRFSRRSSIESERSVKDEEAGQVMHMAPQTPDTPQKYKPFTPRTPTSPDPSVPALTMQPPPITLTTA